LPLALAGLAVLARAARRRRVARGPRAAPVAVDVGLTSGHSQRIPRQTGRTDRAPMAPQEPVALIGWTR
jgi:hypothetical protein